MATSRGVDFEIDLACMMRRLREARSCATGQFSREFVHRGERGIDRTQMELESRMCAVLRQR